MQWKVRDRCIHHLLTPYAVCQDLSVEEKKRLKKIAQYF